MILVREETPTDFEAVRRVTIDAFAASDLGHHGEADLVDRIRESCNDYVSLVACSNDAVVGHLLLSPVTLRASDHDVRGMGLAPMSVMPSAQRQGVGTTLLKSALDRTAKTFSSYVVVLGHPDYYQRFGFVPASNYEVAHGFTGISQEFFSIRPFTAQSGDQIRGGRVHYDDLFGEQYT